VKQKIQLSLFIFLFISSISILNATPYPNAEGKISNSSKDRLLLITGCGRSGTTYISHLLTLCGLDIGHEIMGNDGVASWYMAINTKYAPHGEGAKKYKFKHVFHQVRHPLDVISSFYTNFVPEVTIWKFLYKNVSSIKRSEPHLVKCAKYWYYWNLAAEKKAEWRYRIEDIDTALEQMCNILGIPYNPDVLNQVPKDTNKWHQYSEKITWSDLKNTLKPKDYKNIRDLALKYGYSVNDE
jgi:hypothetical protein